MSPVTVEATRVVVPCRRWVWMPLRTSSGVPEVKEAPPPPWLWRSTKPGTSQWPDDVDDGGRPPGPSRGDAACRRSARGWPSVSTVAGGQERTRGGLRVRCWLVALRGGSRASALSRAPGALAIRRLPPYGRFCRGDPRPAGRRPGSRRCRPGPRGRSPAVSGRSPAPDRVPQWCEQGFPRLGEAATDDQGAGVQQGECGDQAVGEGVDGVLPDLARRSGRRTRRPSRSPPRPPPGPRWPRPTPALTAAADAYRSRQPRCPHGQGVPPGRTTMWPISPAKPCAPASTRPSMPMAPAMPVPSGTKRKRSAPRPAPIRPSARPPVRTSWPRATGTPPSRSASSSRRGRPASRGWPRRRRCPASSSTMPGTATPAAAAGSPKCSFAVRAQLGGEVEDAVDDGVRPALAAGGAAGLVQQRRRPRRPGRPSSRCRPHRGR